MKNYYFKYKDSEICHSKEYFNEYMISNKINKMQVYKAYKDKVNGIFWCNTYAFCGDDSENTCGKQCDEYEPRNGKSGCCKAYTTTLYMHGEKITLTF